MPKLNYYMTDLRILQVLFPKKFNKIHAIFCEMCTGTTKQAPETGTCPLITLFRR